jgi:beta-xylosidase
MRIGLTGLKFGGAAILLASASMILAQAVRPDASAGPVTVDIDKWPMNALVFTSFRGDGDGLHLAVSKDEGLTWIDQNRVFLKPAVGSKLMRDPHISRGPDGIFRMVWTTGWKDKGIGYSSSTDLVNWSAQRYLPLLEDVPGANNAWAPEILRDDASGDYLIIWSSDIAGRFPATRSKERMNHRAYYVTTRDFTTFSKPQVLFDPGFPNIDTTVVKSGDRYIAVFKESDRQATSQWGAIRWAVADKATGPYRLMPDAILSGQPAEGPALAVVGDKVRLYVDFYRDGRYGAFETSDWTRWTDISAKVRVVPGQRHGTVLSAPPHIAANLPTIPARKQPAEPVGAPPAILGGFTADPSIRVFGDTYYLYPTSDKPFWRTTDFSVWSSKNLVDWKKERMILDVAHDLKWAKIQAWAPDVIERDGTYYMYFCAEGQIGVATARSPLGPFVDALGKPLVGKGMGVESNTIDPYPFIDDDGQAYLYFGNGRLLNVVRLKPDMVTLDGPVQGIEARDHREGPVVFKRDGRYYFMWSIDDARSPDYRVGWGTATSPTGPITSPTRDFIVLQRNGAAVGTAHHSVVNVPGTDRWYAAYHRHALPEGGGYQRQTMLARMTFAPDGSIRPMDPMVAPFAPGDAGEPVRRTESR